MFVTPARDAIVQAYVKMPTCYLSTATVKPDFNIGRNSRRSPFRPTAQKSVRALYSESLRTICRHPILMGFLLSLLGAALVPVVDLAQKRWRKLPRWAFPISFALLCGSYPSASYCFTRDSDNRRYGVTQIGSLAMSQRMRNCGTFSWPT